MLTHRNAPAVDVEKEYERWDKAHGNMTQDPPAEGHRYIQHALNLLDLLEPIAEIHPIAKGAIGCFKQLVLFEQDRRENDARVAGVILAQTGMMRVLLDIDDLSARQHNPTTLRAMVELPQMLHAVQADIAACHNSIDTYYKEHKLVKFCKAKDWKARMLDYIETFDRHRVELHQALSLQVASDVTDLVTKMDLLLGRLFAPHESWELVVAARIHELDARGGTTAPGAWMQDTEVLGSLAAASGDLPPASWEVFAGQRGMDMVEATKLEMQLNQMKEELHLSLDVLCQRNVELFGLKLKLHTEQLERAIVQSARFVIDSLSGPHDRLEHEDLRNLWKEMNWMFCVETKVFGIALFEYYLDLYSNGVFQSGSVTGLWMPKFNPIHRYKSGAFKHPEAWTLLYLFVYADKISTAIDSDSSGFIRISEANAFTAQIPEGWTLPQWCAYLVEGQFHENAIYRKRLVHIRNILHEMHAEVLPHNRFGSAEFVFGIGATLLHYMTFEPRDPANQSKVPISPELHELVKEKILRQDAKFRENLQSIKWDIENESTIEVLSSGRPLETYIFPLLLVLMEFWIDLHHLCKTELLDLKEWIGPYLGILALRQVTEVHIKALSKKFETGRDSKFSKEDLQTYHRGTWALLQKTHAHDLSQARVGFDMKIVPLTQEDYDQHYADLSFIEEFPIPALSGSLLAQRKYSTWEEFIKDKDPSTIPATPPLTWSPIDDKMNTENTNPYVDLPVSEWVCDKCDEEGGPVAAMHCMDCPDFDFCKQCFFSHRPDEHAVGEHTFSHVMVVRSAWSQAFRASWLSFTARKTRERLAAKMKSSSVTQSADSESAEKALGACGRCATVISGTKCPFYVCIEYSCDQKDVMLCDSCAWQKDYPEGTNHRWWHTLLPFDSRTNSAKPADRLAVVSGTPGQTAPAVVPKATSSAASNSASAGAEPFLAIPAPSPASIIGSPLGNSDSITKLEHKLSNLEEKVDVALKITADSVSRSQDSLSVQNASIEQRMGGLEERMANVEDKLDMMFAELRRGMEALLGSRT